MNGRKEFMVKAEIFQFVGNHWTKIDKIKTSDPFEAIVRIDKYCDVDLFDMGAIEIRKRIKKAFR